MATIPTSDDIDVIAAWCDQQLAAGDETLTGWRHRILGEPVAVTLARTPTTRFVTVRLDIKAVNLTSQVAKDAGMSRERWLRTVILTEVARATDLPIDALAGGLPVGTPDA